METLWGGEGGKNTSVLVVPTADYAFDANDSGRILVAEVYDNSGPPYTISIEGRGKISLDAPSPDALSFRKMLSLKCQGNTR